MGMADRLPGRDRVEGITRAVGRRSAQRSRSSTTNADPTLAAAVRELPPQRRIAIFLRYFADLSYAEIGETLGIAEGTVAATLSQAHRQLGAALSTNEVSANEVMA